MRVIEFNKIWYPLFILLFLSVNLFAQIKVDSLVKKLSTQTGKERIPTLITLSQQNLYFDSKLAKQYAQEALSLSIKVGDESNQAEAYYYLGFSKYRLGSYTEGINDIYVAGEKWKTLKNYIGLAYARNLIAIINYYIGRYEISTKLYSQNLVYYKSRNMMKEYSKMLTNLANVFYQKGDYNKALENLLVAESYARKYSENDSYFIGNVICNLGEAYFGKKEYALALKKYFVALDYLKKINLTDGIANTQMDIGLAYFEMKDYTRAINFLNLALKNYQEINYTKGVMDVKENIVRYFKEIKQLDSALQETRSLESICIEAKDTMILAKCYNHFADIYHSKGNYASSSNYFRKHFLLKEIIEKENNKQSMIALQILTDAEVKDYENMTLKQENELQKERLKRNMLISFSVTAGLILFSVFLFVLYKKEKNIRKYTALLEKKNEEINVQNNKLEEVILAKDKFFSILAHNLKNPFWAILGLNNILHEEYNELSDEEKREIINRIGSSVKNVYSLFENLLSWAKTQQSAIQPFKENLNVTDLIYNSIKPYEIRAKEKNVNLLVQSDSAIYIFADKFMLETIVGNFVDNAIKFSKMNSNVLIATFYNNHNEVCISIEDSGIGIPEDKIEKLFRIDENISSEGTLHEKGTGLGLIICKEFIQLHKGEVIVDSTVNQGTKFTFKLPKNETE